MGKSFSYLKLFWVLVGVIAFVYAIIAFREIIFILLLSAVIASSLDSYISSLNKLRVPRSISLIIIYLAFLTGIAFLVYLISGPVFSELKSFAFSPNSNFQALEKGKGIIFNLIPAEMLTGWSNWLSKLATSPERIINLFFGALNSLTALVFILVLTFYLSLKPRGIESFVSFFLTKNQEKIFSESWRKIKVKIYRWFNAQIILSALIAFLSFLALRIIGVKYAAVLSLISGIFELIPVIGPILAGTLAAVVALGQSFNAALWVALAYLLIQQTEAHLVVPNIMRKAVDLNPAVVLFLILIGAEIGGGIIGVIVAIPLGIIFREILTEISDSKSATESK